MDDILSSLIDACPPLIIFLFAACLFMNDGCLSNLGGILLMLIGFVVLIVWLFI